MVGEARGEAMVEAVKAVATVEEAKAVAVTEVEGWEAGWAAAEKAAG